MGQFSVGVNTTGAMAWLLLGIFIEPLPAMLLSAPLFLPLTKVGIGEITRHLWPLMAAAFTVVMLVTYLPQLSLWLRLRAPGFKLSSLWPITVVDSTRTVPLRLPC